GVEVFIRLQEGCSWTEWALYDEPDANCATDSAFRQAGASSLQVYPNPSRGRLRLFVDQIGYPEIVLFNHLGQVMLRRQVSGQSEVRLDLSGLQEGLYFIRMHGEEATDYVKVLIRR
ncbi:MAG: T9SS C-terminal target domain-containing protein, partial [Bacteroidetes bacterium]